MYWGCCGFDGRRQGGEYVSHSSFGGSFFVYFGFPTSVIGSSSRLGLGFQSFPSFSGMGPVVGRWVSVLLHGRGLHSDVLLCRGLTLANFSSPHSSASMFNSSVFFLGLPVLLFSWVVQNLLLISCLLFGGVSVLLPVKYSSEDFAGTLLFIGGVLYTNTI